MEDRGKSNFGLTPGTRGWYKRLPGGVKWISSFKKAPTADIADRIFAKSYESFIVRPAADAIPLKYACDAFLAAKATSVTKHTYREYVAVLSDFASVIGVKRLLPELGPATFSKYYAHMAHPVTNAKGQVLRNAIAPERRSKIVGIIRTACNWWQESGWVEKEFKYGPDFRQLSAKERRILRARRPKRLYSAAQIATLLAKADPMMRAAIYLAINGGMGNTDIANLKQHDLRGDVLDCSRSKTGAARLIPLWPSTRRALNRLKPNGDGLLFYNSIGKPLETLYDRGIGKRFTALCRKCELPELGFYTIRRTFRTVTDEIPDRRAVELVTGHVQDDMGSVYVQEVHTDRLRNVTNHVLLWLKARVAGDRRGATSRAVRDSARSPS